MVQVEPSKKNSENETSSVVAIQDACVSAVNITFCRKTIAEQVSFFSVFLLPVSYSFLIYESEFVLFSAELDICLACMG